MCRLSLGLLVISLRLLPVSARKIFHFGDSYSTTLYNPDGTPPSTANPIGNPAFPGITTSGGPNFIGDLITTHPTSGGSPTLVYNYAFPGAVVNNTLEHGNPLIPDLIAQFAEFGAQQQQQQQQQQQHLLDPATDVLSLYFGTNDIDAAQLNPLIIPAIIAGLVRVLADMHAAGARRFVVFGMDPLQRAPVYAAADGALAAFAATAALGVRQWNLELAAALDVFRREHPHATVRLYDTMPAFNTPLDDPTAYGAPNNTCSDLDGVSCLWWNNLHPGQAIHGLLAKGFAAQLAELGFF